MAKQDKESKQSQLTSAEQHKPANKFDRDEAIGIDRQQPMHDNLNQLTDYGYTRNPCDNLPNFVEFPERQTLRIDKHGISFPTKTGIQLRLVRKDTDLGRFYSFAAFGNPMSVLRMAMARCVELREANPVAKVRPRKNAAAFSVAANGVGFRRKLDKRRNESEHFYWASYKNSNGKPAVKTFSLGYTNYDEEFKQHAEATAIYFRELWEEQGLDMDMTQFRLWKYKRLYITGQPACDFSRPRRKRGETVEQHKQRLSEDSAE